MTPIATVQDKTQDHETGDRTDVRRLDRSQLLATLPADRHQQIHGQGLVDAVRKLEPHLQDRDQEPEVEEQQEWLEQVMGEIIPERVQHCSLP